ncbi:peptidoglycan hydrolase CwlO-like protein [Clostridium algifaecis]|uniref:Peptidoglycan hydrolase CwlO-like protein n=1 Tax=Clostridium algifaecis TaxID=1472040 RepID=A0ABS4KPU4_9CLOT|nr:3D domain-containing protein [Clostridium algifaecis]MBP2032063.1 peptidoglycan hydrolase CwlO-like protein [Clostridium algifaecis]
MNKKTLSAIMTLALTVMINGNVFAAPSSSSSDALKQAQDNKVQLQKKVDTLNSQINEVINKIDSNKKYMNNLARNIKSTQSKLDTIENKSKSQDVLFNKRVRAMYMSGMDGYLNVLLSSNNLSDFMSRMDTISKVIRFDKNIMAKLKQDRQAISSQKENLVQENNSLQALKSSNENTLSKLNKDIQEQKSLLASATEKESELSAAQNSSNSNSSKAELAYNSNNATLSRGTSGSVSASKSITVNATAYSGDGITASGTSTVRNSGGYSTIAVDPRVIPLGSRVYVEGYGYAVADDTGGAIKGNRIDVFFPSEAEAESWGVRSVTVYILN